MDGAPSASSITPPTQEETAALHLAARYLMRAGTEAASQLLGCTEPTGQAELYACLSDSLLPGRSCATASPTAWTALCKLSPSAAGRGHCPSL